MVGHTPAGVRHLAGGGVLEHHLAVLVVDVGDGGGAGGQLVEEALLAAQVLREGAVVVQVVVGEVGEDADGEFQAGYPFLLHSDGTDLHEAVLASLLHHLCDQAVGGEGVGGGIGGLEPFSAHVVGDGGKQSAFVSHRPEQPVKQGDGGRLAVGAGYADQFERAARMPVECVRCVCDGLSGVLHGDAADACRQHPAVVFIHHRRGSEFYGLVDVGAPVVSAAVDRYEEASRHDAAGVVAHGSDLHVGAAFQRNDSAVLYDVGQSHLLAVSLGWKQGSML